MERNDARVVLDYVNAKEVLDQKGFTVVVEDDVGFGVRGSDNGLTGGAFRETFSTAAELAAFALGLAYEKPVAPAPFVPRELTQVELERVDALILQSRPVKSGKKKRDRNFQLYIAAIKLVRELTGRGLKEAKQFVDDRAAKI